MLTQISRSAALALVALAATSAVVATPSPVVAAPPAVEVKLKDLGQFVPQELLDGDREFGGNGPEVTCKVTLDVTPDKKQIKAEIEFLAKETKADWTTVRGAWSPVVYTAPAGKTIEEIVGPVDSRVTFVSKPAGFQLLAPTEDYAKLLADMATVAEALLTYSIPGPHNGATKQLAEKVIAGTAYLKSQGNHVHVLHASGPVLVMGVVGDTGGPDVSTDADGKDDTRITNIKFKPIKVRLK